MYWTILQPISLVNYILIYILNKFAIPISVKKCIEWLIYANDLINRVQSIKPLFLRRFVFILYFGECSFSKKKPNNLFCCRYQKANYINIVFYLKFR